MLFGHQVHIHTCIVSNKLIFYQPENSFRSAINLLLTNKTVYNKLEQCSYFWKNLCVVENLDKFGALKNEEVNTDDEDRTAWSGKLLNEN